MMELFILLAPPSRTRNLIPVIAVNWSAINAGVENSIYWEYINISGKWIILFMIVFQSNKLEQKQYGFPFILFFLFF